MKKLRINTSKKLKVKYTTENVKNENKNNKRK